MSEIISIISAKGGAGKTSIAVNLAHAAASCGLETLVIDCDLYTNGASIFYNLYQKGRLLTGNPLTFEKVLQMSISGCSDLKESTDIMSHIVPVEERLDFIPAGRYPVLDLDKIIYGEYEKLAEGFSGFVSVWGKKYDVIILDQPSGINTLVNIMVSVSTKVLLVKENDKLGLEAARELYNYLSGRTRQIVFCTNKIPAGQYPRLSENKEEDDIIIKCTGFKYDPDFVSMMEKGEMIDLVPYRVAQRDKSRYLGYVLSNISSVILKEYSSKIDEYLSQKQAEDDVYVAEQEAKREEMKQCVIKRVEVTILVSSAAGAITAFILRYNHVFGLGSSIALGVLAGTVLLIIGLLLISRNKDYDKILEKMINNLFRI